jgi:hypothetical protein
LISPNVLQKNEDLEKRKKVSYFLDIVNHVAKGQGKILNNINNKQKQK